jgi:IstB-like ATP binding protein
MALAEAAIQSGFGAYFITAHDLVVDLARATRENRLGRRMRVYLAPKLRAICRGTRWARRFSSSW